MKFMRLFITTAALLLISLSASAHEELVEFSPGEGEVVQAGLVDISLSFSDDLISLGSGGGNEIIITQLGSGKLVNNGCAVVDGRKASTTVDLDQPGEYNVAWRVVSGDGHPISGSQVFVIENQSDYVAEADYQFLDCPNAITQIELEEQTPEAANYWLLWISISAVALGLFLFLRPKRK
jgi:methionine-rich copper-binding protein CopC